MLNHLLRLYRDDQAATAVEYAVLLALILMAVISAISAVGNSTHGIWANDANQIDTAVGGS
ncbi:MAG: Flp family type IVb pilin [Planctomycetaceae bacterium]|jgi:pilus assembly protein Flp/PilA|nr:Flp family type IVb pilin [Planctomycetaceae bacterium]MBV8308829.1 Flp family type IVb pilin [Planctomycetaceae bacterium]